MGSPGASHVRDRRRGEAVTRVLRSGKLFRHGSGPGGPPTEAQQLEREWAERFDVRYSLAVTSGTAALVSGLVGMGIEPGSEVILPGYTYVASALAPLATGAVPVLAEVDASLMLDPEDVKKKLTPRTAAIIPVHVHGHVANLGPVLDIAREHGLRVLEDCAQCIGGLYRNRPVGSLGEAGAFSFNFFKILTAGEGGMLTTSDPDTIGRARVYSDPGDEAWWPDAQGRQIAPFGGVTFRTDELHAAVLRVQLRRLSAIRARLRHRWDLVRALLLETPAVGLAPVFDEDGDCGTSLSIRFESGRQAEAFLAAGRKHDLNIVLPRDTGCHVYRNWKQLTERRGAHHPAVDPLHQTVAGRAQDYTPEMLPQTLRHLEHTALLGIDIRWTDDDCRAVARAVRDICQRR